MRQMWFALAISVATGSCEGEGDPARTGLVGDSCDPTKADCVEPLVCVDGRCRDPCVSTSDCPPQNICTDGACRPTSDPCLGSCDDLPHVAAASCDRDYEVCIIDACENGWADADDQPENGCECTVRGDETCNGLDDDCNGVTDDVADLNEECSALLPLAQHVAAWVCDGSCAVSACDLGWSDANATPSDGCEIECVPTLPPTQVCDGLDNDCDGSTDNDAVDCATYWRDDDGDGLGDANDVQCLCGPMAPYTATNGADCDDSAASCTDDCVTNVDLDDFPDCRDTCLDVDADEYGAGTECLGPDCDDDDAAVHPGADEVCDDGNDNDCDGDVDDVDHDCWAYPGWPYRIRLSFDNSGQAESLIGFPVRVTLGANFNYDVCDLDGADLRFVDGGRGAADLPHELDTWSDGGTSEVWVEVPRIEASSATDYIWLYYGNPGAPDTQRIADVWSTGYEAVYHLNASLVDSAGGFDATDHGTSDVPGVIGRGRRFEGAGPNDYIDLGSDPTVPGGRPFLRETSGWTLAVWMQPTSQTDDEMVVSLSVNDPPAPDFSMSRAMISTEVDRQVGVAARSTDNEGWRQLTTTSGSLVLGSWNFVAGVVDYGSGDITAYVNGVVVGQQTFTFAETQTPATNTSLNVLGSQDNPLDDFFHGLLDEVRIARVPRTEAWLRAQYECTRANSTFVLYGTEEAH